MDIKNAWENKTVRISVIGAALIVLIIVISQSIFSTPVKKEKKTQKKDMQTGFLIDDSQMTKLSNEESQKTYNEMVRQNRIDQNAAKADRDKAEKAQQESKVQIANLASWIGPYISIHFLSLNPLLVRRRRYSRGERYPSALCGCHSL